MSFGAPAPAESTRPGIPGRSLRIVFLDSWWPDAHTGSGTAVGIRNLEKALRRLGHAVTTLRASERRASTLERLAFNLCLPRGLASAGAGPGRGATRAPVRPVPARPPGQDEHPGSEPIDLIVGFDMDGFRWSSTRRKRDGRTVGVPAYVVCLKGIAADEAEFSRSLRERLRFEALIRLERANARGADRVVVPSRYSAEVAIDRYGLAPERVAIVPEALDLEALAALRGAGGTPRRAPAPGPTILSIARQYPRKDTATLLNALPRVRAVHPRARLRVIGGGPELPRLRRLARELGLGDAVRFDGAMPDDGAVQRALAEATVFCLPSRQEGFGIVFVEAMAAGIPVVAARAGAVPEVIRDGKTGILVPPGDERALADALVRVLGDSELRHRLGRNGPDAAARYGLDAVGSRFLEAVAPVLSP